MSAPWLDLTLPIAPNSVAWAGLPGPKLQWLAQIDQGDAVSVASLNCCLHTGTHADAPLHVDAQGKAVAELDPSAFVGRALVVRIEDDEAVSLDELNLAVSGMCGPKVRPERLLIATPRPYDGVNFPDRIPTLTPEALDYVLSLRLRLLGVDVPSLDALDSRTMVNHKRLFGAGVAVLENLDLGAADPGWYELVAPPLAVIGAEASPVRALARRID